MRRRDQPPIVGPMLLSKFLTKNPPVGGLFMGKLPAGVEFFVFVFQVAYVQMGVDLGGRQIGVAQHFLQAS